MNLTQNTLINIINQGENHKVEFKSAAVRPESIAREITAFANYQGGTLLISKEELSRLFQQAGLVHFDIAPIANTSLKDLDLTAIDNYYQTYYEIPFADLEITEQEKILYNADILTQNEGQTVATVGGLLLFGKQPQRRLPQAAITFAVFKGNDITDELIDKKEITGTLPELIDKTVALVQLFLPVSSTIEGTKRQENILIPYKVIREAIVNAVSHRDYSISQRKISVYLFSDRLEITSPGNLPNTLTLDKIRYGNSSPRNIFLVKFLDNMRYFDGLGRGIPMIIKSMGEKVSFNELGVLFKLKFKLNLSNN